MNCNVRNANYEKVLAVLERFLKDRYRNACSCTRCINEMAAIALNYLPPHYYYDDDNRTRETGSPWVMVESAVVEAIEKVKEVPHHAR